MKIKHFKTLNCIFCLFAIFSIAISIVIMKNVYKGNNTLDDNFSIAMTTKESEELERNLSKSELSQKIDNILLESNNNSYPSYYGGMFINDDSTHLIVQIVKNNEPNKISSAENYAIYDKIKNMDKSIELEYVDTSYNDLSEAYNKLNDFFLTNPDEVKNIKSYYIDIKDNTVKVSLYNKTDDYKNFIKSIVNDSNIITFIEDNKEAVYYAATTLYPGLGVSLPKGNCSVGFHATVNGEDGFFTSAHCVKGLNTSTSFGKVTGYKFSTTIDAAFISTTSSFAPTNVFNSKLGGVAALSNYPSVANPTPGSDVAKYGYKTGYTTGKVVSSSIAMNIEGFLFSDLIGTSLTASGGDSGAPVFVPGVGNLLGLIEGGDGVMTVAIKSTNIRKLIPYTFVN